MHKSINRRAGDRAPDFLRALTATSRSIVITDATQPDNPVFYANAAFSALCGYPQAEVVGRNCRFLQGPDTDPQVRAEISEAIASGVSIRREILNYRKDGTPFWNDLSIDPICDTEGMLVGFVSSQYEVTAARLANEKILEAESRLNSIVSNIPGYIYQRIMRNDGTIEVVYCSPSLGKMLEIDETEVSVSRSFYNFVHQTTELF